MKKCFSVAFVFSLFFSIYTQNTRKFELSTDSSYTQYTPTGNAPEMVVQEGNSGSVTTLRYTNDGKYLLAGTFSDVKIYDAKSGYLLKSFEGRACKDFSPDGKYFVSLSHAPDDYGIIITNIETGKERVIGEINHKRSEYVRTNTKFGFSPNGKYLAVPMVDWVDIYYVETFEQKEVLKTPLLKDFKFNNITGWHFYDEISWSPDSRFICCITGTDEGIHAGSGTSLVYEIMKGYVENCVFVIKYTMDFPRFSPMGNTVAFVAGNKDESNIYILNMGKNESPNVFSLKKEKVCGLSFTPDGNELIVLHESSYSIFKFAENWKHGYKQSLGRNGLSSSFAISPDSTKFIRGINREIEVFDFNDGHFIKSLKGNSKLEELFQNTGSWNFFSSNIFFENPVFFNEDFVLQERIKNLPQNISKISDFASFSDGFFYHEKNGSKIMQYDFYTCRTKEVLDLNESIEFLEHMISTADGNNLAIFRKSIKMTEFYKKQDGKFVLSLCFNTEDGFHYKNACYSTDGSLFFGASEPDKVGYVYDFVNRKLTLTFSDVSWGQFSPDNKFFAAYYGDGHTEIHETESWNVIKKFNYFHSLPFFSHDGKNLAMYSLDDKTGALGIEIYETTSWKKIKRIEAPHVYKKAYFSHNKTKIFILDAAGIIRCYSSNNGKLLANFMYDEDGNYFTYTPEGYFTGSPGGINKFVHLVDGMQVFELGQLYDTLYRPDLVQAKLEGKDIGENPLKKIVATGDAPRVQFTQTPMATSRQIKLEFSVQDTGGGIGYVYLSQNGKAMQVSAGEKSKVGQRFIYTCDVTLAKGENVFEAYAANSANKIESRHVSSTLSWQGKVEDSNLYVLAIGVDKYIKMPQNNLKYSVADATGIIESFKASPGGLYGSVNVMTLLDSDVSKDNIQKAFETFASKVKPDDMFVLHLAGHGVNYGGEYYYLPSDTLAKSDSDYPKVGVSKHFLTESLSEIQSLNTIILLDTCYSGAFIDAKAQGNELAQKTALEHLAHTSGQVILTASANSQTAAEGYKGHGIFTYAIMEAISGKANYNADSTLSIKEITQYVGYEVPNIYEKMGLARQSPWNSPLRGDFSVVATGNRQSPQFHEVSLDGGKRTDWVTVRTDDSDVGNFENALASAKKEAKKTSRSSGADQRSRGKGIYVGLGYGNTRFGSGFDISPEFYFLGWKHFYAGVGSDIIYKGAEKSESGKDIRKLDTDIKFLLGYSYTFKRLRPYLCGGVGGYFSGDAKEKEIFVSSNSKTGVVTKTVYESDAKTGFVWEVAVGSDILLAEHFVIGAQYKLKNFVNCGFTDTWTVTIGWPF